MKNHRIRKSLLASALAVAGLAIAGQAQATAYSYSSVALQNFTVEFDTSSGYTKPAVTGNRYTFASSSYTDDGTVYSEVGGGTNSKPYGQLSDVSQSFSGPGTAPPQNTWGPALNGTNYGSRADARTDATPSSGYVRSVTESNVHATGSDLAIGGETANNSASVTFTISGTNKAKLRFDMLAFWDLQASVTNPFDVSAAGGNAFFSLRPTTSMTPIMTFSAFDEICASGSGDPNSCSNQSGGFVRKTSDWSRDLFAGTYRIDLLLQSTSNETAQPVPEPATMSLLGAGLVGLAAARRRKARATRA